MTPHECIVKILNERAEARRAAERLQESEGAE